MKLIKKIAILILIASCSAPVVSPPIVETQPEVSTRERDMTSPWENTDSSILIDAYSGNSIDWIKLVTDKKNVAIIHKSSEGLRKDSEYQERRKKAIELGYPWGAYHLGTRDNVEAQVNLVLSVLKEGDLFALDLEDTESSRFISTEGAIEFVELFYKKTGKVPVIYTNHSTVKKLNSAYPNHELLKKSKLWYARFRTDIPDFPKGIWSDYFLWQFSSEINCTKTGSCLYNVPGTKFDMDVNVFNGTSEELKKVWVN